MPIYHQLGRVPQKRHVAFRKEGGGIHYEELIGNQGFVGPSSLLYHLRLPTAVTSVRQLAALEWAPEPERVLRHRHFRTAGLATGPSAVRLLAPYLSREATAGALRYAWQAAAGLYSAFATAPPAAIEAQPFDWDDIIDQAVATGDEHAIKFAEACLREHKLNPSPAFPAAARDAAQLLTCR